MPLDQVAPEAVRSLVDAAIREFGRRDLELLHVAANERTLTHRLAIYIEERVRRIDEDWQVDCEYNRDLTRAKMVRPEGKLILPDINVHRRNTARNLLLVEAKKTTHARSTLQHAVRMAKQWADCWGPPLPKYDHAVLVVFPLRPDDRQEMQCHWFHRGAMGAPAVVIEHYFAPLTELPPEYTVARVRAELARRGASAPKFSASRPIPRGRGV